MASLASLDASISALKALYLSLGTTYFAVHSSLHNNPLIALAHRDRIAAEFATPAPFEHHIALTISQRESALTPFESTVVDLETCLLKLYHLSGQHGTLWEDDGNRELSMLDEAQGLLSRAATQLAGLLQTVEVHFKLERVLADMGVSLPMVEKNERLAEAERIWWMRVAEWVG